MKRSILLTALTASSFFGLNAPALGASQDMQINLRATVAESCSIVDLSLSADGPETALLVTASCNADGFLIDVGNAMNISIESAQALGGVSSIAGINGSSVSVLPAQPGLFEFRLVLSSAPGNLSDLDVTLST